MAYERKSVPWFKLALDIIITIILIALQIVVYYFLFIGGKKIPYLYAFSKVLAVILVIHLFNTNDNISYKLTWTAVILSFSFAGPFLYLSFGGGHNLPKRKYKKIAGYINKYVNQHNNDDVLKELANDDLKAYRFVKLLREETGFPLYRENESIFFNDGKVMFEEMLNQIDKAQKFIFMEYFILASGIMLDTLFTHLEKASERGIDIRIIYDYVGSYGYKLLKRKDRKRLYELTKGNFVVYNPLGKNLNLGINYRDHRKILLIDDLTSFVGGINIADEYIHEKNRFGYWRDNGMMIRGRASHSYLLLFAQNWYMSTKEVLDIEAHYNQNELETNDGYVFPFGDGPNNRLNPAYDLYLNLINSAEESILISTPYFVIDKNFVKALCNKAKSQVEVILLFPGIPDKKLVYLMASSNLNDLISAGAKVYLFKMGFNHAKSLVIDHKYAINGTFNIDYRSMFLHFECCNLLIKTHVVTEIEKDFRSELLEENLVTINDLKKIGFFRKLLNFFLSILGPLV